MINYKDYAERFLAEAVESLDQQTYFYKLFIVDNSSTPESQVFIKKTAPDAEVIINIGEKINRGNNGFAKAGNQGFQAAIVQGYDYIVMVNMDVVFDKDWLKNLVIVADSDKNIGAVQSKILMYEHRHKLNSTGNKIHFLGFGYCEDYGKSDAPLIRGGRGGYVVDQQTPLKEINYASGCSVLYKAEVLKEVGMFDENYFMYHEDSDLSWRIWQAGYKVVLAPTSVIYHKYEFNRSMKQFYYMERNRLLNILTNYKLATLILILPAWLLMELGLFLFAIKNKTWTTKLKVYLYFINPIHWLRIYNDRIIKQSHRKVPDKNIVKNFTGKLEFQEVDNPVLKYIANPFFALYWAIVKRFIVW